MTGPADPSRADRARATTLIVDAWENGLREGIDAETMASAAIFAALADLVDAHGEQSVAAFVASLPKRILEGEFTLAAEDGSSSGG